MLQSRASYRQYLPHLLEKTIIMALLLLLPVPLDGSLEVCLGCLFSSVKEVCTAGGVEEACTAFGISVSVSCTQCHV